MNINLSYKLYNDVPIGIYRDGPVGINVSCGADSAILLYILMQELSSDIHIYSLIGEKRKFIIEPSIDKVIMRCAELTGKKNYFVHKIYAATPPVELLFETQKNSLDSGNVDIIYTGLTKFPPNEVWSSWGPPGPSWHINWRSSTNKNNEFGCVIEIPPNTNCTVPPLTIDGKFKDKLSQDARVYNPLINHDKKSVVKLYDFLNIRDKLFSYTRSCENDNHIIGHCGKCWWCRERFWAFGHLE